MQSPIQEILENLKEEVKKHENNLAVSVIFSAFINYIEEMNLPQKEADALNRAFNDGRFYMPHIEKPISNYHKEKYNGKKD